MDAAYTVADKVELIHPARFLFNAGSTPKAWNSKMLSDKHFKINLYEPDATKVFNNTDIKGGVAISYRDATKDFGEIGVFTQSDVLNKIIKKINYNNTNLTDIIYIQNRFNLDALYEEYPQYKSVIGSDGKDSRFEKNIFEKVPIFFENKKSEEDILTTGIYKNRREKKYIEKKYVDISHESLYKYKVITPVANGKGEFGSVLGGLEILAPQEAYTRSFIGIGATDSYEESKAILSYLKTKFLRTMLSILKVTQMNNKDVWKYVPLQDFSDKSDIDWSKSLPEIDKQLYKKYGLTKDEIDFIETNVKEMV
jgi:Eco57I restriction endonuclease.